LSMTSRAAGGVSYILLGSTVQTLLRFVVIGVLARHLSPADFGIVAAAMIVVSVIDLEGALGIAPALIQRKELEPRHLETGQLLALLVAIVLAGGLYLAAGTISRLLSITQSAEALRVLCLVVLLRTAVSVSEALLYRKLLFRRIAAVQVISYFTGYALIGVGLALVGFGYWSLVYAEVAQAVVLCILYVWQSPPPTRLGLDRAAARELLGFGISISAAKLLRQMIFAFDQAVVARLFGAAPLGFYVRAQGTTFRPINALGGAIESVLFPMMATIQNDTDRVRTIFVRGMAIYCAFVLPVVASSAVLSYELIYILLGRGWDEAALLMQLLAAGFFFRTANRLCATILKSRGKAAWLLLLQIEHALVVGVGVLVGARFGIEGVAIGASVAQLVHFLSGLVLVFWNIGGGWRRLGRALAGTVPVSAGPVLLGAACHAALISAGAPWALTFGLSGALIGFAWTAMIFFIPLQVLGDEGRWLLQALSSFVPRALPMSAGIRKRIARSGTASPGVNLS